MGMTDPILNAVDERILTYLVDHGGECVREIADGTGLTVDQVRFSLSNLLEVGMVRSPEAKTGVRL
jgi:predicted ArsR family transcriptional regulator